MGSKDYPLSMTGSGARRSESVLTAALYLETGNWSAVRKRIVEDNEYQMNTESSLKRVAGELIKRLKTLSPGELRFLVESYGDDQLAMLWVSICRAYPFMRAFSQDALALRYRQGAPDLTVGAYEAVFEAESIDHPELEDLAPATRSRMRNQILQMTRDCRLTDEEGRITPLYLSPAFTEALGARASEDLRLFPRRM